MDLFREFQPTLPDELERNIPQPDDAWLAATLGASRSMRDAARWLLGIVIAWLFLVPQLTGLRELLPPNIPWCVIGAASLLLLVSVGLIVWSVVGIQTLGVRSYDTRDLGEVDLEYVQEWGFLVFPLTPEQWRDALEIHRNTLEGFRYLTPEDTRGWMSASVLWTPEGRGLPRELPHTGEALFAWDQLRRMRLEERNAMAVLTVRDVGIQFRRAIWVILGGSLVAAAALLVLVGPPAP